MQKNKKLFAIIFIFSLSFKNQIFSETMNIYGHGTSSNITVIDSYEIETSAANNVLDLLTNISGVYVNKSGNDVSLFFRGIDSTRIAILINGKRLSSIVDLDMVFSFISLNMIERIEVVKGNASNIYGAGAIGGAINIVTKDGASSIPGTVAEFNLGSTGSLSLDFFNAGFLENNMFYSIGVLGLIDAGKFPGLKKNIFDIYSYNSKFSIAFSGKKIFNSKSSLDFFLPFSYQQLGRKASLNFPDDTANLNKIFFSPSLAWEGKFENSLINIGLGFNLSNLDYFDSDNLAGPLDYRNFNLGGNFDLDYNLKKGKISGFLNAGLKSEGLISSRIITQNGEEGLGSIARVLFSGNGGFLVSKNGDEKDFFQAFLNAGGASSLDFFEEEFIVHGSGSVEGGFVLVSQRDEFSSLRLSSGYATKQPSFEDLFWPNSSFAVGNLSLRPEHMLFLDAQFTAKLRNLGSAQLNLFYQDIKDYILWNQGPGGLWRPQNLSSVVFMGYDFALNFLVFDKRENKFNLNFMFSNLFCFDNDYLSTSFSKQLPLRPFNIFTIELKHETATGHVFTIAGNYTGERYLNIANTAYRDAWFGVNFLASFKLTDNIKILISGHNFVIGEAVDFEDIPFSRPSVQFGMRFNI